MAGEAHERHPPAVKLDLTVGACIIHGSTVLVLHHAKLDKWLFPGGHIEPNETPDAALEREVLEETGLRVRFLHTSPPTRAGDETQHLHLPFWTNVHSVGDHSHYCAYYLCAPVDPAALRSNHESFGTRWVSLAELDALHAPESVKEMARWALHAHSRKSL